MTDIDQLHAKNMKELEDLQAFLDDMTRQLQEFEQELKESKANRVSNASAASSDARLKALEEKIDDKLS